jgi:enamine deaminase RidA (YjgF/YER057c/UK114 family)
MSAAPSPSLLDHVQPPDLFASDAYTNVVVTRGERTAYVSGQIAIDGEGHIIGEGDFAAQAQAAFVNLGRALRGAGMSFGHVAKLTIYLTDIKHLDTLTRVRARFFERRPPASTLVEVKALVHPALMVEVEAVAVA